MSGREIVLSKEKKLTRFDWFRKTKHTLRLRCTDHGLSTTGKKADSVDRLFTFMHPPGNQVENVTHEESGSSDEDDENPHAIEVEPQPNTVTLDSIRSLIQEELSAQSFLRKQHPHSTAQAPATNTAPLSPASFAAPLTVQEGYMLHPSSNIEPNQGLSNIINYRKRQSLLPPVSEKILNDIKHLTFIDFNSLLPNALYAPGANTENLLLELNQSPNGAPLFSFQPAKQQKRKINNAASWMEAWNIYIRAMTHFHPSLISELLVYQDFMCTLQRSYPTQAWLRYDTAFRLHIALDKTMSWSDIDEHAFTKFVRCASFPNKISCFTCSSENHLANACPQRSFRPKREPSPARDARTTTFPQGKTCKFFNSPNFKCAHRDCKYTHKCSLCGGTHPAFRCVNSQAQF